MKEAIIERAIQLLEENPLDAGHDLSHHQRVRDLALMIAEESKLNVDRDALEVASMWHDIQPSDAKDLLTLFDEESVRIGLPEELIQAVQECISTHSFDSHPILTEAQVLFDADKLDALSLKRGRRIANSLMARKMPQSRKQIYLSVGRAWVRELRGRLHFDASRKVYDERVMTLLKSREVEELAGKLEIDISDVKASLKGNLSPLDRVLLAVSKLFLKLKK